MNAHRQAGFTLLETSVATAIAVVLGLGVVGMVTSSRDGARIVREETKRSESLRAAAERLVRELKQTNSSRLSVAEASDGNHVVKLQTPLSVTNGVVTWGVRDATAGDGETDRERANWTVQYRVAISKTLDGQLQRWLVREILDDQGGTQKRQVLLRGVADGRSKPPGFQLTANGTMWRVALGVDNGDLLAFDVALMN